MMLAIQLRTACLGLFVMLLFTVSVTAADKSDKSDKKPSDKQEFYTPVERDVEGWTIALDPKLLEKENKELCDAALQALANHLQRVKYILPEEKVAEVQKLRIWLELNNPKLGNMQYHPDRGWLIGNGHDPRLVKHVHIPPSQGSHQSPHLGQAPVRGDA